jgi:ADP-ribose pyrophosphatase
MKVDLKDRRTVYDGFVRLEEATLRHERFDGTMSDEVTRLNVDRGDSAAAVVLNLDSGNVILTEQFRYPAYTVDEGWLLELPAGSVNPDEDPAEAMRRELVEELGYAVDDLRHISTFYSTPGTSSERIWLYLAEVHESDRVAEGGGAVEEGEDIRAVELPVDHIGEAIADGRIKDAKTLVGLLWLKAEPPPR